ncbi:reverse transcriptase/ribonuclease [Salix suchowensis]|nr:reverse transcriptase/ribonuclease [Salix suchowensis]
MAPDIPPLATLPPHPRTAGRSTNPEILRRVKTPYNVDAFEEFFRRYPHLVKQFPNLVLKLRQGFPMGEFPTLSKTVTWPNAKSVERYRSFVDDYFAEEVMDGRLSGPFSQTQVEKILGGPFQSSPITVNVQPQEAGEEPKLRLCIDLSRRTNANPSTNAYSDIRQFPTKFDSALEMAELVAQAPNGAQAMTLDISKFHRRTPICAAHKRWFVMQAKKGQFYIQHCCPFGSRASEGNSGEIANAALAIWKELGVGPICKWADDMVVFRHPTPWRLTTTFAYDRKEALKRIASLGVPWHPDKGQDFSHSFTYVGFLWNLSQRTISLPPAKRQNFHNKLLAFLQQREVSQIDAMTIQGTLAHVIYVYPLGRSHMALMNHFVSSFDAATKKKALSSELRAELNWWLDVLNNPKAGRSVMTRGKAQNLRVSVDASGEWGIGMTWGKDCQWAAWKSRPGWKAPGRDIGWLEGSPWNLRHTCWKSRESETCMLSSILTTRGNRLFQQRLQPKYTDKRVYSTGGKLPYGTQ